MFSRTILGDVQDFVALQHQLIAAFRSRHPEVSDWQRLLDAPRAGQVRLGSHVWQFVRHGCGLRFVSESNGTTVDVHRSCDDPSVFDAWRLSSYLESQEESAVESQLAELAATGQVRQDSDGYRLSGRSLPRGHEAAQRPAAIG